VQVPYVTTACASHTMPTDLHTTARAAMAGSLPWATRAYNEMLRRRLKPTEATFALLFLCARNYGVDVRVQCARSKALLPHDDRWAAFSRRGPCVRCPGGWLPLARSRSWWCPHR
jgi:hypothetical protein